MTGDTTEHVDFYPSGSFLATSSLSIDFYPAGMTSPRRAIRRKQEEEAWDRRCKDNPHQRPPLFSGLLGPQLYSTHCPYSNRLVHSFSCTHHPKNLRQSPTPQTSTDGPSTEAIQIWGLPAPNTCRWRQSKASIWLDTGRINQVIILGWLVRALSRLLARASQGQRGVRLTGAPSRAPSGALPTAHERFAAFGQSTPQRNFAMRTAPAHTHTHPGHCGSFDPAQNWPLQHFGGMRCALTKVSHTAYPNVQHFHPGMQVQLQHPVHHQI